MANLDLLNMFWKRAEQEQRFRGYASTLKSARPFTLDAELAGIVSDLANSDEARLRSYLQSARLPYPVMWLEADYASIFRHEPPPYGGWKLHAGDPVRCGWLLMESPQWSGTYSVTRISSVPDDDTGEIIAALYPVTRLFSPTNRLDIANAFGSLDGRVHPEVLAAIRAVNTSAFAPLLGWINKDSPEGVTVDDRLQAESSRAKVSPLFQTSVDLLAPQMIQECVDPVSPDSDTIQNRAYNILRAGIVDQTGELGVIVAALALLNEVPCRYVPYKPSGHLRAGGRMKPFMSSSIVTIEVPATRRRLRDIQNHLKLKGREAAKHARHEVRGHWRHVKKLPLNAQTPERWERHYVDGIPVGWRIWIDHHERGDASLGWVQHTYHGVHGRGATRKEVLTDGIRGA